MRTRLNLVLGLVLVLTAACFGDPPLAPAPNVSLGGTWEGVTAGTTSEGHVHEATIVLSFPDTPFRANDSVGIVGRSLWKGGTVTSGGYPVEKTDGYGGASAMYDGREIGSRSEVPTTAQVYVAFWLPSDDDPYYPGRWPARGFYGEGVWDLENETLTVTGRLGLWTYCDWEDGWGIYGDPYLVCEDPVGYTSTIVFRRR